MVATTLKASGHFKNKDGSDIEIPNPRQVLVDFDTNLNRALDADRKRAAILKAVAG